MENQIKELTCNDWSEAPLQIWIGSDNAIHYDDLFKKRWKGSFDYLLACVKNNIKSNIDDQHSIDWLKVQDDYNFS